MYGGSTGGWEALGAQIFYPDEYNGCWAACPDPIDFRAYTVVDIYATRTRITWIPSGSDAAARACATGSATSARRSKRRTAASWCLARRRRSGQQWDIWEAVFSPVGPDGYPKRILDKRTGVIDRGVADVLEGALRPFPHPAARLEQGPGREARRQDPHLCRRHGQLLFEQCGLSDRRRSRRGDEPAVWRRDRLRRPRRALLERRPHAAERRCLGSAITRCSRQKSSNGSSRARRRERISRAGATRRCRSADLSRSGGATVRWRHQSRNSRPPSALAMSSVREGFCPDTLRCARRSTIQSPRSAAGRSRWRERTCPSSTCCSNFGADPWKK